MVSIRQSSSRTITSNTLKLSAFAILALTLSSVLIMISLPQTMTTTGHGGNTGTSATEAEAAIIAARGGSGKKSEEISPNQLLRKGGVSEILLNANDIVGEDEEDEDDPMKITEGKVTYENANRGGGAKSLPYYHCGPTLHDANVNQDDAPTELVLLHGAAFTKTDWKSSGILDTFCEINNDEDGGNLLLLALDLPVSADGVELGTAFDSLVRNQLLSGNPVTFITPSASGKGIVNLGEMMVGDISSSPSEKKVLKRVVKAWIPVATGSVLKASEEALKVFETCEIPILSIHGDKDEMGKKVTTMLESLANAKAVELSGTHPVYLDSPDEFVSEVLQFLEENGL